MEPEDPDRLLRIDVQPHRPGVSAQRGQYDFNILMGLCVGHDSLFLKYAEAPCTVLVVKDRLLGHNPLAAIYTIDGYYRSLKTPIER